MKMIICYEHTMEELVTITRQKPIDSSWVGQTRLSFVFSVAALG